MAQRKKTSVIIKAMKPSEKIVAELWCGSYLLGGLIKEKDEFQLEIYAPPEKSWNLELNDFLQLLDEAKKELSR